MTFITSHFLTTVYRLYKGIVLNMLNSVQYMPEG